MLKTNETVIRRTKNIPWQVIDQQALILATAQSMAHELNETGTWIWQQLESQSTLEQLVEQMCLAFEVDLPVAKNDLLEFLDEMQAKGILECQ